MLSTEFFVTSLVVVLVPGTGVIYTVSTGLTFGRRASIVAAFGCTLGIVPHLVAGIVGLSAVMHTSAVAFQVVKYLGVLYLLVLAWSIWRDTGALSLDNSARRTGSRKIALRGVLLNLLNPKLTLFFLAFLPQFILPGQISAHEQMIIMSVVFMSITLVIFAIYGILASSASRWLSNSAPAVRRVRRSIGLLFAALAVRLALSRE